ncbi:aspartate 1-decarboxylase [Desulfosoma caldarium]|uniref:Aspartate 1-decarboxylase n=1 Tax=Desulfosoma caldarium TaxID=610254 RepID=A0A3N1VFE1_9BACT|nr:aspartate 1-decarboxylase [Desulfosoma caldarium]ROR01576.1 L-aspartate 1-decarboxylase [Desulfosoma caldarium]
MRRTMMKSKLHRACVTDANLHYEGSLTIDAQLMELADILPYEQVRVYNVSTGARFETYAIEGPRGGGDICLNGAAARMGAPGDFIIIVTYAHYEEEEARRHTPRVVLLDERNKPKKPELVQSCRS